MVCQRTLYQLRSKTKKNFRFTRKKSDIKRQKLRTDNFQMVGKAVFNWFLSMRSQNVSLSVTTNQLNVEYRISFNKRPRRLLNFETVRCGAY